MPQVSTPHSRQIDASISLIPISDRDITHTHTPDIPYEHRGKSPQQNTGKQNLTTYKKDYIP